MSKKSRKSPIFAQNSGKCSLRYDYAGRIQKCCKSWHECVQKWEDTNNTGLQLATKIVNEELQKSSSEQDSVHEISSNPLTLGTPFDDNETQTDKEKLVTILYSLKDIHEKMSSLTSKFEAISSLWDMKEGVSESQQPVFETWLLENFVCVSRKLMDMFERELYLKERLVGIVLREATAEDRSKLLACLAMWLHQPYIEDNCLQELKLMLLETGLQTS